jgi:hypothetical protein
VGEVSTKIEVMPVFGGFAKDMRVGISLSWIPCVSVLYFRKKNFKKLEQQFEDELMKSYISTSLEERKKLPPHN